MANDDYKSRAKDSTKSFLKWEGYICDRLGLKGFILMDESIADWAENVDVHGCDYYGNGYNIQHKKQSTSKIYFEIKYASKANGNYAFYGEPAKSFLKIDKADYFTFDFKDKLYIFNARTLNLVYYFFPSEFDIKVFDKGKKNEKHKGFIDIDKMLKLYNKIMLWQTTGEGGEEILAQRNLSGKWKSIFDEQRENEE